MHSYMHTYMRTYTHTYSLLHGVDGKIIALSRPSELFCAVLIIIIFILRKIYKIYRHSCEGTDKKRSILYHSEPTHGLRTE